MAVVLYRKMPWLRTGSDRAVRVRGRKGISSSLGFQTRKRRDSSLGRPANLMLSILNNQYDTNFWEICQQAGSLGGSLIRPPPGHSYSLTVQST